MIIPPSYLGGLVNVTGGSPNTNLPGVRFAATDNQNNTGAVGTITGSNSTDTNAVYVINVGRIFNSQLTAWQPAGVRSGDGNVNLILPYGTYWGYCLSYTDGPPPQWPFITGISPPSIFAVTVSPLSVYSRIMLDVQARLQMMNLPGIKAAQVYMGMFPSDRTTQFPAVWVTKEGLRETQLSGTNVRDDWGHPVNVFFADRNPQTYEQPGQQYDLWRQMIRRGFERARLPNVPEVYDCLIEPNAIIDPRLPHYQYLVSGMVLRFKSREPRGTN
jgi:hypothetical protein